MPATVSSPIPPQVQEYRDQGFTQQDIEMRPEQEGNGFCPECYLAKTKVIIRGFADGQSYLGGYRKELFQDPPGEEYICCYCKHVCSNTHVNLASPTRRACYHCVEQNESLSSARQNWRPTTELKIESAFIHCPLQLPPAWLRCCSGSLPQCPAVEMNSFTHHVKHACEARAAHFLCTRCGQPLRGIDILDHMGPSSILGDHSLYCLTENARQQGEKLVTKTLLPYVEGVREIASLIVDFCLDDIETPRDPTPRTVVPGQRWWEKNHLSVVSGVARKAGSQPPLVLLKQIITSFVVSAPSRKIFWTVSFDREAIKQYTFWVTPDSTLRDCRCETMGWFFTKTVFVDGKEIQERSWLLLEFRSKKT